MKHVQTLFLLIFCVPFSVACRAADPLPQTIQLEKSLLEQVQQLSEKIKAAPDQISLYSSRGDAYFFLRQFGKAVSDYDRMVELDQEVDASHWRRGIAYFYNGEYDKAAAQFDRYHSFDNVDRENGIWRYFSMYKAKGAEQARQELLRYEKDDREPFPDVYNLFAGKMTPLELVAKIELPKATEVEREKCRFYGYLYLGLNESIEGRDQSAQEYLQKAVDNTWGPKAGYGPNYMWHVGRIHLEKLRSLTP